MEQNYHLRSLYQGETPFPFSCQTMISEHPCCSCESEPEGQSERSLSQEELDCINRIIQSTAASTLSNVEPPLTAIGLHIHDHCQITECLRGLLLYVVGRTTLLLSPGDVLIINELIPHAWATPSSGAMWRHLGFYPHTLNANSYSQRLVPYFSMIYNQHIPYILIKPDFPRYATLVCLLDQIDEINKTRPYAFDAVVHNVLFSISMLLFYAANVSSRLSVRTSSEIESILQYIEQNISGDLSLQAMAQEVNMNPCYFSAYFKKHLGVSYKKYVTTKKVGKAADLLRYSQLSVTQILFDCGFSSVSAFYSAFNQVYSISPLKFRNIQPVNMYGAAISSESDDYIKEKKIKQLSILERCNKAIDYV